MNRMSDQVKSSKEPCDNKLRFGIRSLFILVAVVALVIGISTKLWNWYRIQYTLNVVLATKPRYVIEEKEIELLAGDRDQVVVKLVEIIKSDDSEQRRANAERLYSLLQTQPCKPTDRAKRLPQMIDIACDSNSTTYESEVLLETIAKWIPLIGVSSEERARIRSTALAREGRAREPWIHILSSIGGREETQILLDFADENNLDQRRFIIRTALGRSRWKGLVSYLERWLQDPSIAEIVLESSLLSDSVEGRSLLIRFVTNPSISAPLRQKGLKLLLRNTAGIDQLVEECKDSAIAEEIEKLVGPNSLQYLATTKEMIASQFETDFWKELLEGITVKEASDPAISTELDLKLLAIITGDSEIQSKTELDAWKETHDLMPVSLESILRILIVHPELIENWAILNRIRPYLYGEIPGHCRPLYDQLLCSENPEVRFSVGLAMLKYSESPAAVDAIIDLAESDPDKTEAISCLQQRFAVNYFRDFKAWREWREKELPDPIDIERNDDGGPGNEDGRMKTGE